MNHKYNRKLNESIKKAIRRVVLKEAMGFGPPSSFETPNVLDQPQQPSYGNPNFDMPTFNYDNYINPDATPTNTTPPGVNPDGPGGAVEGPDGGIYWYSRPPREGGVPTFYWDSGRKRWMPIMWA